MSMLRSATFGVAAIGGLSNMQKMHFGNKSSKYSLKALRAHYFAGPRSRHVFLARCLFPRAFLAERLTHSGL